MPALHILSRRAGSRWRCGLALVLAVALWSASAAELPSLRELAAAHGLQVGTAVKATALAEDSDYRAVLLRQFAMVTPENEMKFKFLRTTRDRFEFDAADRIVEFAQTHQLQIRGHTLCWTADQHLPPWLLALPATPAVATELLREHIFTLMQRYRGRVRDWDVVNEAVSNDNRPNAAPYVDGYWHRALGDDYVALAFRLAHEADPEARLYYNDYDHGQALGPKSDRIYNLLKQLRAAGVPVHGVGLQMHCNIVTPPRKSDLVKNLQRLAALDLKVTITELDVEIMTSPGSREERLVRQAQVYRDAFEAAIEAGGVEAVVMWGFSDKFRQAGLLARKGLPKDSETPMWLFDASYQPKPAFYAVAAALSPKSAPPPGGP